MSKKGGNKTKAPPKTPIVNKGPKKRFFVKAAGEVTAWTCA